MVTRAYAHPSLPEERRCRFCQGAFKPRAANHAYCTLRCVRASQRKPERSLKAAARAQAMQRDRDRGLTYVQIAKNFGVSVSRVSEILSKLRMRGQAV